MGKSVEEIKREIFDNPNKETNNPGVKKEGCIMAFNSETHH